MTADPTTHNQQVTKEIRAERVRAYGRAFSHLRDLKRSGVTITRDVLSQVGNEFRVEAAVLAQWNGGG
jgi:hypothetical protein